MTIGEAKEKLLYFAKQGYDNKFFAGTSGNLSIREPQSQLIAITPSSIRYEGMSVADIVVIDLDGNVVEGIHQPSSEYKLHCAIYRHLNDINSVVHTHSPFATAFAVNRRHIPLILIEMIPFLGGDVPNVPLQLPGSDELAMTAVDGLKMRYACLLDNHGVVAVGDSIEKAYLRAEYVEDAAKICHLALANGEIHTIPDAMVGKMVY